VTNRHRFAAVMLGVTSAALALAAACSGLDPTPPNPHFIDDPELISPAVLDAGHDAPRDAP
jgi:hypothetical protein